MVDAAWRGIASYELTSVRGKEECRMRIALIANPKTGRSTEAAQSVRHGLESLGAEVLISRDDGFPPPMRTA